MVEATCDPIPMAKWLEGKPESEEDCRPCAIAILVGKYQKTLTGHPEVAQTLTQALEDTEDPVLRVAEAMDRAKEAVPPEVKDELRGLDCIAQNSIQEESNVD